ncbi:MAG: VWA domain-containing protein [Candidatus Cloacimonetes bacterium]|nr:VWA domain-containing protein [Candidatus Cloacimonadota bacterium]
MISWLDFAHPAWLWALLLVPAWLWFELAWKRKRRPHLPHPRLDLLRAASGGNSAWRWIPLALRGALLVLIIVTLAQPRLAHQRERVVEENLPDAEPEEDLLEKMEELHGIDIILAIDVSASMRAVDLQPTNRLEAAKQVGLGFIAQRTSDRIGLVSFSSFAVTRCPLTSSYAILERLMNRIEIDPERNGTSIGTGLAMSVARLRNSQAQSKVVILITDGRNNTGEIQPEDAARMAALFDIKVYPVGVGREGLVDYPLHDSRGRFIRYTKINSDIDMQTLDAIAGITGTGRAARAQSTAELAQIIEQINRLETSAIEEKKTELVIKSAHTEVYYIYTELFSWLLLAAVALGLAETALRILLRRETP